MKTFFRKHRIVLIALIGVLCIGIFTGLAIAGTIRMSMTERAFSTVADAKKSSAPTVREAEIARPTPVATQEPEKLRLSAQEISRAANEIEQRRGFVIPVRNRMYPAQNLMLWSHEPADYETAEKARATAETLTEIVFGKPYEELTGSFTDEATVTLYTDASGDRAPFLRIVDRDGVYWLTVNAADHRLICADLFAYPETAAFEREIRAKEIAKALGYNASLVRTETSSAPLYEGVYTYQTDADEYLAFTYCADQLCQAAVYPSLAAMEECEYFLADVQFYNTMEKAYPEDFVQTAPPGKRLSEMATASSIRAKLSRLYAKLTDGEQLDNSKLHFAFLQDNSGVREDCWHVTGEGFDLVVSAYSRNVITLECSVPCAALLEIPYEQMGGAEYMQAAADIARYLFTSLGTYDDGSHSASAHGKDARAISVNAVHDGSACTMDVELEDGTFYELGFEDGVWVYSEYYANERLFAVAGPSGWVANNVYLNPVTGKPYIPDYRDWDGDFHITRPEQ